MTASAWWRLLGDLAERIMTLQPGHPARVGIDGHSTAGRTTFADELADVLRDRPA